MQLASWNPFREMDEIFRNQQRSMLPTGNGQGEMEWSPTVDIKEFKKEYLIEAELPGVNKDQVHLSISNGVLTMDGERHSEKESGDEKHHRLERYYGHFSRSFSLPEDVEADKIAADSKDGIIRVHLPKTAVVKPKSIEIKIN